MRFSCVPFVVRSDEKLADFFTKPLPRKEFELFRKEIMNDTA